MTVLLWKKYLTYLIGGTATAVAALTDNPVKDMVKWFGEKILGVSAEMMDAFINFMWYCINLISYSIGLIIGLLFDIVMMFGEAWIVLIALVTLIMALMIFCVANLYTCFLIYEFFILAMCIQEHRSPTHKITLLFEYQVMVFYVLIFLASFLFKIPTLLKELGGFLFICLQFAWIVLSDIGKIISNLIPFT